MKTCLLILILIIGTFQNSAPPQKISNALIKKFPSAKNITWQKGADYRPDYWKANFILGGKKATVTYSSDRDTAPVPFIKFLHRDSISAT